MLSPWPPSTNALTFSTETSSSRAMNVRNLAESSTPAMPITRSASSKSSALPWGMPSTTSTSTTSPSSFSTTYWATLAPTLPAPTTVIFARAVIRFSSRLQGRHVLDDLAAELRALHFLGAFHEAGEVVGDDLRLDGLLESGHEAVGRIRPAQVTEHHLAREDDGARVDLVLARVLRRGAVGGLEQRVARVVVDVG